MSAESTFNGKFIAAGVACALLAGGVALIGVAPAQAATAGAKTSIATGKNYTKAVANGKTAGSAKASAAGIKGIKIALSGTKGTISYKLTSATAWAKNKNGKVATPGAAAQTLSVSLSGAAKKKCDVYYRTYTPGYGWLGWAKNGQNAGAKVEGKVISAVQVKLVKKNSKFAAYNKTKSVACISNSGFYNGLTGDAATDAQVAQLAQDKTLEQAFKAFIGTMDYSGTGRTELGYSFPASRLLTEGKQAFSSYKGDCYTYTAGFTYVARFLGYQTTPVAGKLKNKLGVYNSNSWCLVKNGERDEIWNAQLQDTVDADGTGLAKQNKLAFDENGQPVKGDNGNYVYEKDEDGNTKIYTITIKTYGFTKDEKNDYNTTFEKLVFTGYGYATSAAEEI